MSNFSPMFFEQPIVIFDTTQSLNATSGAFVLYGGVSINATYQSTTTSSGAFVLSGGMAVQKDVSIGGIQHIYNTTQSSSISDGALIVDGGVGIAKNLNVGGNTTILGNLYVEGTYTYVNTQTINVEDNTLVINAGPAGSRDAGLLIHRDGADVTSDVDVTSGTLAAVNGTSITFGSSHQQADNYYRGWWVKLNANDKYAQIDSYSSGSNSAVLSTAGNTLLAVEELEELNNLDFYLYNRSYLAQYYDEQSDEIRFGYVADAQDPKTNLGNNDNYAPLRLDALYANTSISTSSIYTTGMSTIANLAVSNLLVASVTMDNAALKSATIGSLYVTGESILHGAVTAGALNITGDSILQGFVTAGALAVTGESFLRGAVTAGALTVSGASVLNAGATAGALYVTGGSLLQGDLTVSGASVFNAGATAGALNVTGASIFQLGMTGGSLYVTGQSILQGFVTAGALNITGDSILQGFVTAGALAVTGESFLRGAVTAGALTVSGASVLNAGATAGALYVTGGSLLQGDLTVSGASVFNAGATAGALNVTGASLLHLGLTGGSLYVTGQSILQGFVTAGSLNVTGASIMEDNLTVTTGSVTISTNDYSPIIGATSASHFIIFNTVDVSPSLGDISRERIFLAANDIGSPTDITGFAFDNTIVRAFDAIVSVTILVDGAVGVNKYAYYNLKGIHKLNNWVINSSYVGDVTGFTFSIGDNGQIKYTSTNISGYIRSAVNFRAMTTSARSIELSS